MTKAGVPPLTCASTSTRRGSRPTSACVRTRASTPSTLRGKPSRVRHGLCAKVRRFALTQGRSKLQHAMAGDAEPLPWDSNPFPGWVDAVDAWRWQSLGDGDWEKHGSCPRCTHSMDAKQGGLVDMLPTEADAHAEMLTSDDAGP